MDDKKLFLLDAYALIYRAYYALIRSPRITSAGFNASAVFGFCNTLDEVLRKENPSHIAVCFDPKGKTFRHEMYDGYKANREAQPEDISLSVPIIKDIVTAYNIPVFEVPSFEADDIIGTLARKAAAEGFTVYMMTPDKDYGQLVTDNVLMYKPSMRGQDAELRGPAEIRAKYGIASPALVVDLLALEGDSADNIPGCPGVGPKTATRLINQFGSIENLLDHAAEVKGALGQKISNNADQIRFSKRLATISTDVPLEVDFDKLRRSPADTGELRKIFTKLEFKSFLAKLSQNTEPRKPAAAEPAKPLEERSLFDFIDSGNDPDPADSAKPADSIATSGADYAAIEGSTAIERLVAEALQAGVIGISVYATGPEAMTATLRGVAVAPAEGLARFVDVPADEARRKQILRLLAPLFTTPTITLSSADIKRDMVILRREGISLTSGYFDASLAHYLLQPEMRHRLADIAMNVIHYQTSDFADGSTARKLFAPYPAGEVVSRTCEHADVCLRLVAPLRSLLDTNGQLNLLDRVELPLAAVLADMEWTGVRIDSAELNTLSTSLSEQLRGIEEKAYELAGERFNIGSPMQVGEVLFGKLKLNPKAKRTKTGAFATTEEILEKHRGAHPVVGLILQARSLKKLLATYVNALPELVNPATGKIHTTFNQTITATGRISSANPNLQNIPIRTDDGREVRRAFIADDGCLLLSADYSQIELRLLADLSNDPELTEAFNSGLDIHRATASKLYRVPYDAVTDTQRRNAKTANFGTIYGISAFGLSERLGISRIEARRLIDSYFATYPHIKQYTGEAIEKARKDGFVSTIMGRKRYLPDITSRNATVRSFAERNAVNAPLQGSAADIIKVAMIDIHAEMKRLGLRSKMILQVHDELIFNVVPNELSQLRELVERLMTGAFTEGSVRLDVSSGVGANWLEAH